MQIKSPLIITSRLMLGVKIGEGTISIEYAHRKEHRQYFRRFIDLGEELAHFGLELGSDGIGVKCLISWDFFDDDIDTAHHLAPTRRQLGRQQPGNK